MVMFVADIGGTNIRFARLTGLSSSLKDITHLKCQDFTRIEDAFVTYRKMVGYDGQLDAVTIAVAAPVNKHLVEYKNNHWAFSKPLLKAHLDTKR